MKFFRTDVRATGDGAMSIDQRTPLPPVPPLDPSLPVPIAMIVAGLEAWDAVNPADLSPQLALQVAQVLLNVHDRTKAHGLAALADVEHRQLHNLDDSPSTGTWVVEQATSFTRDDVALARKLDRIPQVAARIAEGALALKDGVQIGRALDQLRPHVDRPDGLIDGQPSEQALYGVIVDGVCVEVGDSHSGWSNDHPRLQALHAELLELFSAPLPEITRLEQAFLILARTIDPTHFRHSLARLVDALLPHQL